MNNIIDISPHIKTIKTIAIENEIDNTDSYRNIFHLLHKINGVNQVISLVSKAMYYEDYKNKSELYIVFHSALKTLKKLMKMYSEELSQVESRMDNVEYEQISNQAEDFYDNVLENDITDYNDAKRLQLYLRSLRGEVTII